jgi:hypothetical protein
MKISGVFPIPGSSVKIVTLLKVLNTHVHTTFHRLDGSVKVFFGRDYYLSVDCEKQITLYKWVGLI